MIKFGPSGNSASFYAQGNKATVQAPAWCAQLGLNVYEYSFGRGINVSDATANAIGEQGQKHGVEITVHAPYYINLANPSDDMAEKSFGYILNSARKVKQFFGNRVVFHPSTVGKMTRQQAVELTKKRLETLAHRIEEEHLQDIWFCPETMGKINQIGDAAEVVEFCKIAPFFLPTIDFGHLNARTQGGLKTEQDFEEVVLQVLEGLGRERADKMHVHFSKIEYSAGGEVRHLTFADTIFGPEFEPLARVLCKHNLHPTIVCESDGTQAEDALQMKNIYQSVLRQGCN